MHPTAAPARLPYAEHRTMAEVMQDEFLRRPRSEKGLNRTEYNQLTERNENARCYG